MGIMMNSQNTLTASTGALVVIRLSSTVVLVLRA